MLFLPLLTIIGAALASPVPALSPAQESLLCKAAGAALSVMTKPTYSSSALAFCSSYIHIPAVTQVATITSFVTATTTPTSTSSVTPTSVVTTIIRTTIPYVVTSVSRTTTTTTTTTTPGAIAARSADALVERDEALLNTYPTAATLDERGVVSHKVADALKAVAPVLVSAACSCIKSKITLATTVSATTTIVTLVATATPVVVTVTPTTTTTTTTRSLTVVQIGGDVPTITTTTTDTVTVIETATPAPAPAATPSMCSADALAIGFDSVDFLEYTTSGQDNVEYPLRAGGYIDRLACCMLCFNTPGCVYYSGDSVYGCYNAISSGGEGSPGATQQCPSGLLKNREAPIAGGFYGIGQCATY